MRCTDCGYDVPNSCSTCLQCGARTGRLPAHQTVPFPTKEKPQTQKTEIDTIQVGSSVVTSNRHEIKGTPIVTIILVCINVFCFILETMNGENATAYKYAMYEGAFANGQWIRAVTSGFLHYGIYHLASNMFCLISFGLSLEKRIGSGKFAIIYLVSLIGGSILINYTGGNALHAGASGAIWGLMVASLIYNVKYHGNFFYSFRGIAINLIYSFTAGVSWQGHIGGGIAGGIMALILLSLGHSES